MESQRMGVEPDDGHEFVHAAKPAGGQHALFRLLHGAAATIRRAKAFVAGVLIGVSAWMPVFVATAEETALQQYGLPGGLAMLGAGIWLRMGTPARRRREAQSRRPAGPSRAGMDHLPA